MKPKNFSKKLTLKRETIAYLDSNDMIEAYGGGPTAPGPTCPCVTDASTLCRPACTGGTGCVTIYIC